MINIEKHVMLEYLDRSMSQTFDKVFLENIFGKFVNRTEHFSITCCSSSFHLCLQRNTAWTSSAGVTWFPNMEFATTSSTDSSAASPVLPARGRKLAVQCTCFFFLLLPEILHLICKDDLNKTTDCLCWKSGGCWWSHTPIGITLELEMTIAVFGRSLVWERALSKDTDCFTLELWSYKPSKEWQIEIFACVCWDI